MPITTYLQYIPKHPDNEIQYLLEELSKLTDTVWCAEVYLRQKHWFKEDWYTTYLYKELIKDNGEFQQLTCVATDRELIAYLYGALGQIEIKKENK